MPSVAAKSRTGRTAGALGGREGRLQPEFLIKMVDEAFHGPAWHGPALEATLHGCTHAEAGRRLATGRNTVWELVLHAAYGKYVVRGRLTNERRRFARPLHRSWWPRIVDASSDGWSNDLALLDASHAALVEALSSATPAALARRRAGKRHTLGEEVIGITMHDTYHAGQIALIRKLIQA